MTPDINNALDVKSRLVQFMMEQVYRGDYDNPRLRPDAVGAYHYKDGKLRISCQPSPREGWHNCIVKVYLARRRFLSRRVELVMETGYGVDVYTFRPGLWVEYVFDLAKDLAGVQEERAIQRQRQKEDAARRLYDENFSPVDDAAIFKT